ncbi:flightin isoform X2 [Epargyreus clarus]|uniref:flightin isoform X2 n=1 Tax=Epargyreus clarus TaxID=520877 RepID=UPI003C2E99D8
MWDDVVEETPAPEAPPAEAAPAEAAPAAKDAPAEGKPEVAEPPPPENVTTGTEPKKLICKHWVRPKFLQYTYNYDYQKNYYDDLIAYFDRRNKGLPTERPRAQTWGERALRTYLEKNAGLGRSQKQDSRLLHHISIGARFHRCHTKSLISRITLT